MRELQSFIERDLQKKFVFLTGPRQVGKTYLASEVIKKFSGQYYNWDLSDDRREILAKSFLDDQFVILDELHKYARWKNFLKGIYDKYHERLKILVTGSARLDIFQKGGDSLLGRYYLFHLHPLTMGEIEHSTRMIHPNEIEAPENGNKELLESLLRWGGFPEPFYAASEEEHNRWSDLRRDLLVKEEIRDLTHIHLFSLVEHLILLLPHRVGSPLSINSLREDLQVSYNTIQSWLNIFERLFITYSLKPYTKKIQRSIHKEKKIYLWDWSQIKDEGNRFENLVASHLLKAIQTWRDLGFGDFELYFLRDRDRREVDFCITKGRNPWLLVEAKVSETQLSENLAYFSNRLNVPGIQLIQKPDVFKKSGRLTLISADRWLLTLP